MRNLRGAWGQGRAEPLPVGGVADADDELAGSDAAAATSLEAGTGTTSSDTGSAAASRASPFSRRLVALAAGSGGVELGHDMNTTPPQTTSAKSKATSASGTRPRRGFDDASLPSAAPIRGGVATLNPTPEGGVGTGGAAQLSRPVGVWPPSCTCPGCEGWLGERKPPAATSAADASHGPLGFVPGADARGGGVAGATLSA